MSRVVFNPYYRVWFILPPLKLTVRTWNTGVGRWVSFWEGQGARCELLVLGSVILWYWDYKCTWVWKICWFNGYPGIQSAQEYHSLSTRSASSRLIHPTQLGFAGISPPLHSSSPWNLALNVVQGNLSTKRHASITSYHVQPKISAIESLLWRSDEGPSLENGRMSTAQGVNLNDKSWTHTKRYLQAKQIIGPPFN